MRSSGWPIEQMRWLPLGGESGQLLSLMPFPPRVRADQLSLFGILSVAPYYKIASRHRSWAVARSSLGQLSESDAVDALRLPFYSSSHPTGSHGWRNQFDLGNPDLMTPAGWQRADQLRKSVPDSNQAFVAMSFDPSLDALWEEGIEPALTSLGFNPYRVDHDPHNEKIDDRIVAEIRRSGILVADVTNHRPGVYYEAGLATGLNIPVLGTCRDTDIALAHFDTRQFNHVVWTKPGDLKDTLAYRIAANTPGRNIR